MPILMIALVAFAVFGVIGILLATAVVLETKSHNLPAPGKEPQAQATQRRAA
jgi:hypothetical protein